MDNEPQEVTFERALGILRRRAPWIVLAVVLAAGAAFAYSSLQTKEYTGTASLVFDEDQFSQQLAGLQPTTTSATDSQQGTNVQLVQLGDTAAKTAGRLDHGLTAQEVADSVTVSPVGTTSVVSVSATATSPALAAAIANTYSHQFINGQRSSNRRDVRSARALVNRRLSALTPTQRAGSAGVALQDRAESLAILGVSPSGNVRLAQAASVPTTASSPAVFRDTAIAAVLGLLVGLGISLLLERVDRRIRGAEDLEAIYGLPLLGGVPDGDAPSRSNGRKSRSNGRNGGARKGVALNDVEAFRMIHAHLRSVDADRDLQTLLVASAAPGEGKTKVARQLAATAAATGRRALLIEADLRRPAVAEQFGINATPGLADVLTDAASIGDAIQRVKVDTASRDEPSGQSLDVLVAGSAPVRNPGALIESRRMHDVLHVAKSVYDLVVIDTPPLGVVSDAVVLLTLVDGAIIVGRVGSSRRDVAERLHSTLLGVKAPLIGVVANNVETRSQAPDSFRFAPT